MDSIKKIITALQVVVMAELTAVMGKLVYSVIKYNPPREIDKAFYIGDVDKDGHKDIAAVFIDRKNNRTYKILYGTEEGTYTLKVEGLGKDGLPLDYSGIEKIAIEQAKKLDKPAKEETGRRNHCTLDPLDQQSTYKVINIGDVDKDGLEDLAAVFKDGAEDAFQILYGGSDGTYVPSYRIDQRATEIAKKLLHHEPITEEAIKKKIVDNITNKTYKK